MQYFVFLLLLLLLLLLFTAIECSVGGSSYISSKQEQININKTIQKHSKYKHAHYQNTHTIVKTPTHYKTHTNTHTHIIKQVTTTTVQDTHPIK